MSNDFNDLGFYVVGYKGYNALKSFVEVFGNSPVSFVVYANDKGSKGNYFNKIEKFCSNRSISHYDTNSDLPSYIKEFEGWRFAIGWKQVIKNNSRLIVLHDSLLPKYRGFAPLVSALINGDQKIGVTAILASEEYDKGDIIDKEELALNYPITIQELLKKITPLYSDLIHRIYKILNSNLQLPLVSQDDTDSSYSIWLNENDYFVDWKWSAKKIKRFIDATGYPYDNAKTLLNEKIIKIIDSDEVNDVNIHDRERHIGKIIFFKEKTPVVICGSGLLMLNLISNDDKIKINLRSKFKNYE
jgi:methionyl-tRNA formyltransferase